MTKLKINVFLTEALALALFIAGCASTATPRDTSTQTDPASTSGEATAKALVVQPIAAPPTPAEIRDLGNRIQAVHEVMYSVVHNTYSLYLGGQYTATYHADDGSLNLLSDGGNTSCGYTAKAELKDKGDDVLCRQWLNDLSDTLTQLSK